MRDQSLAHAVSLLPPALRMPFQGRCLSEQAIEEIRLRTGRHIMISVAGMEQEITGSGTVTTMQMKQVMEAATRSSLHSAAESLKHGYVTSSIRALRSRF